MNYLRATKVAVLIFGAVLAFIVLWHSFSLSPNKKSPAPATVSQRSASNTASVDSATAEILRARAALAEIVEHVDSITAEKDSAALLNAKTKILALRGQYPQLYDYDFLLSVINDQLIDPSAPFRSDSLHTNAVGAPPRHLPKPKNERKSRKSKQVVAEPDKITLAKSQIETAERLYVQAYQIMAYKNTTAYRQALKLLQKAQEIAPDKKFKYYVKAQTKITFLKKELAAFKN